MNQVVQLTPTQVIEKTEKNFAKVNTFELNFKKEALFAAQALTKNEYLGKVATKNPNSLKNALLNVGAIGISLNPALHDAYLVPRDGSVCLDISYKGLIKIATESGAIKFCKAELVYENDSFKYKGPAELPEHHCDPFTDERGKIKGVYCITKTKDDDILVEIMTKEDIESVKRSSPTHGKSFSPWMSFEGEMTKKACIKRASKTWPRVEVDDRLREAVHMLNESEGYEFGEKTVNEGYRVDTEMLALVAPTATKMIEMAEAGKYWELGVLYDELSESEMNALNTAKTKGGYFNAQDTQKFQDLRRQFFTERNEIQERIQDSVDAIGGALLDGDDMALTELINELDDKEFHTLKLNFDDDQMAHFKTLRG